MSHWVLSPKARDDLAAIWAYTVERWGEVQAERYLRQIRSTTEVVAASPERAPRCDGIREGYRRFTVGSHVLFLRIARDHIEIVRILHQRMDVGEQF